jgi:hypothetical protein
VVRAHREKICLPRHSLDFGSLKARENGSFAAGS